MEIKNEVQKLKSEHFLSKFGILKIRVVSLKIRVVSLKIKKDIFADL